MLYDLLTPPPPMELILGYGWNAWNMLYDLLTPPPPMEIDIGVWLECLKYVIWLTDPTTSHGDWYWGMAGMPEICYMTYWPHHLPWRLILGYGWNAWNMLYDLLTPPPPMEIDIGVWLECLKYVIWLTDPTTSHGDWYWGMAGMPEICYMTYWPHRLPWRLILGYGWNAWKMLYDLLSPTTAHGDWYRTMAGMQSSSPRMSSYISQT